MANSLSGMTRSDKDKKLLLQRYLKRKGYVTYARFLNYFDVQFIDDNRITAYMVPSGPDGGRIVINANVDQEQAQFFARHEMLHDFLSHELNLCRHIAKRMGIDYDDLVNKPKDEFDETLKKIKKYLYSNKAYNIAADMHESNVAYTEADKNLCRHIELGDQIVRGLVTEDFTHDNGINEDWTNLSLAELYDKVEEWGTSHDLPEPPGMPPAGPDEEEEKPKEQPPQPPINPNLPHKRGRRIRGRLINPALFVDRNNQPVKPQF